MCERERVRGELKLEWRSGRERGGENEGLYYSALSFFFFSLSFFYFISLFRFSPLRYYHPFFHLSLPSIVNTTLNKSHLFLFLLLFLFLFSFLFLFFIPVPSHFFGRRGEGERREHLLINNEYTSSLNSIVSIISTMNSR